MAEDPEWAKRFRARVTAGVVKRAKVRYKTDVQFRKQLNGYAKFHQMFRNLVRMKRNEIFPMTGCTLQELADHLEKQFLPGMTWGNYPKVWNIDHIDGLAMFDLTRKDQVLACWNYTNLRPMFATANFQKHNGLVLRH